MAEWVVDKPKPKPVIAPPNPMKEVSETVDRLAKIVMHVAQMPPPPPPQLSIPPAPAPQPRPKRIEATITRDSSGKMDKVVLTPIY